MKPTDHYGADVRCLDTLNEKQILEAFFALGEITLRGPLDLCNAVAKIALHAVQDTLPQVGIIQDGEMHLGRQRFEINRKPLVLFPRHLFMINWADTAPGISWPESYHVVFFPVAGRYVVTASQDSTDAWGFTEIAIGHFEVSTTLLEGCRRLITQWWRHQFKSCDQQRWAYVWREGTVSVEEANAWADSVWTLENESDEEED